MYAGQVLESLEQAKERLRALRSELERNGNAPALPEAWNVLGDLQDVLGRLNTRYELLRGILARTNDALFAKDRTGRYVLINQQGAELFGKSPEEIVGLDDTSLLDAGDAERVMAIDREVMSTGELRTVEAELRIRGAPTILLTTTSPWHDPPQVLRGVIGCALDVSKRRHDERSSRSQQVRLRTLATEIVLAEERLRHTLALELQSGLGQDIALVKLKLSVLRHASSSELRAPLAGIEHVVEQADRSLRSIAFRLSPPSLRDLGLVSALQWLAEHTSASFQLDVQVEDGGIPEIRDERRLVLLFRAVRELLVNVGTHAAATEARVRLDVQDGALRIAVSDNGVGFDPTDAEQQGYGLFGIRAQLEQAGGSLHIDSTLGSGSTITLLSPLPAA